MPLSIKLLLVLPILLTLVMLPAWLSPSQADEPDSYKVQNLSYTYDNVGNILNIQDTSETQTQKTMTYTYDDLSRLMSATSSGLSQGDYAQSYGYDKIGNMTYKSDLGTMTYDGTGFPTPHAVTDKNGALYEYDANGNLLNNGEKSFEWNIKNQLVRSGDFEFTYDANGQRVKSYNTQTGETIIYVNRLMEVRGDKTLYYAWVGDSRVGAYEVPKGSEAGTWTYIHQDHLGGTTHATDESGKIVQVYDYEPYGASLINESDESTEVPYSFTGKEYDEDLGLYYFEARYYDPEIGRFVSVDPMEGNLENPQSFNKYSYVLNNPLRLIDITGKYPVTSEVTDLNAGSGLVNYAKSLSNGGASTKSILSSMSSIYGKWSSSSLNTDRYVYMQEGGWVDLKHFFSMAKLAYGKGFDKAIKRGEQIEKFQATTGSSSAYSFEDLTSNTLGAYFGAYYLNEKLTQGYTFDEALSMFFEEMGGASSEEALGGYSSININGEEWELPEGYTKENDHPKLKESQTSKESIDQRLEQNCQCSQ